MGKAKNLVVISGPSGVGKSTIARMVVDRTGAELSVSATTRPPRRGEVDGRDYHFVDRAAFEKMIARGELLEWAEVFGGLYGTPGRAVRQAIKAGKTVLLEIDVQGGKQVHRWMPDATFILILPPGEEELARRLHSRGSENGRAAGERLAKAKQEIQDATTSGVYNHVVVNDDLETTVQRVADIINQECCKA